MKRPRIFLRNLIILFNFGIDGKHTIYDMPLYGVDLMSFICYNALIYTLNLMKA